MTKQDRCRAIFQQHGWNVVENGWPDFLIYGDTTHGSGKRPTWFLVEAKDRRIKRLSSNQANMAWALHQLGFDYYVCCPGNPLQFGYVEWHPGEVYTIRWGKGVPPGLMKNEGE
jgi:hypothetical protein